MGSQPKEGHTDDTRRRSEAGNDEAHPVERAAAELSDRAAESVSRTYDGTKEAYSIDPGQVDSDEDRKEQAE